MICWYTNKFKYNLRDKLDISEIIDSFTCEDIIAELRQPKGPPSGAPYPYREINETHELIFSCYHGQWYFSWARMHGGDSGVAQQGGHTPNSRLIETCAALVYRVLFWYMTSWLLWSITSCQIKLSADQYHVTILQAQVYSSLRWRVLLTLTPD